MATTSKRGYPYDGINDKPNGPLAFQKLAEALDFDVDGMQTNLKYAKGNAYESKVTVASPQFTALTVISNIPSFTFKAGRKYEIVWDGSHSSTVASDTIDMQIATCSTTDGAAVTTGLTVRRQKTFPCSGQQPNLTRASVTFPVDTTLQVKFLAQRGTGTGQVATVASANVHILYQIFDQGAF